MTWWGRESGQAVDLDRLRSAAGAAGVNVIEDAEGGLQIHAAELDPSPDAATAHSSYTTLVRQMNGLLRAQFGFYYSGVKLDCVIEIGPDGVRRATAIARSNVVGPVLPAEAPPPEPAALAALDDVRADADLAEAIERYAGAQAWPDLHAVFEIIWAHLGKGATARERIDGWTGDPSARNRFTGTAQRYRHPRPTNAPPQDTMSYPEAHAFIGAVLRGAAADRAPAPPAGT
jgi:hypothetical protein